MVTLVFTITVKLDVVYLQLRLLMLATALKVNTHTPSAKQCLLLKSPSFPFSLVLKSPLTGEALAKSFCRTVGRPISPVDLITFSAVLKRGSSSCVVINNVASMFGV